MTKLCSECGKPLTSEEEHYLGYICSPCEELVTEGLGIMEDHEIVSNLPSEWHPTTDLVQLGILGKSIEELGECISVLGRCICQGITGTEPRTRKRNVDWLTEEVADSLATLHGVIEGFQLSQVRIRDRQSKKLAYHRKWWAWLRSGHA